MILGIGEWFALGAALAFAVANVLTRVASTEGDPLAGTVIRLVPVALFGLVMMRRQRQATGRPQHPRAIATDGTEFGLLLIYSVVVAPLAHVLLFLAFRYGGVLVAVPFFSTFPLLGAIIAIPFLGQALDGRVAAGIVVTVIGIALLTYGQYTGAPVSAQWPLGALFGLLTALAWAISSNLSSHLVRAGVTVYTIMGVTMTVSSIIITAILAFSGRLSAFGAFSIQALWSLILSGLLLGVAQYFLFSSLGHTTVASASTIKTLDVGLATAAAVLFLGEALNLAIAGGILLIIIGVVGVQLVKRTAAATGPLSGTVEV